MREQLSKPVHESYLKHRKDTAWKIIFPVVLSSVLCIGLIVLIWFATFRGGGDVQRWADISTMWIAIPVMIMLLVFLALLGGIVYLLAKLLNITPKYTILVQDFFYKIEGYARRGADAAAKPFIFVDSIGASINRFLERLR
jgi:energy-coupling factor transporter transmembrane protein EcfT